MHNNNIYMKTVINYNLYGCLTVTEEGNFPVTCSYMIHIGKVVVAN